MEKPPARLIPLLTAAADLRAAGGSWAKAADKVQRDAETCRHWPRRYPDAWKRLYRQAEDLMLHQAGAEAVATLRGLLVDPDSKVRLGASRALLRAQAGARALEGPPGPEPPDDGFRAYLPYLKSLSDAELVARVRSYLNAPDADDEDDPPPAAKFGPASPPTTAPPAVPVVSPAPTDLPGRTPAEGERPRSDAGVIAPAAPGGGHEAPEPSPDRGQPSIETAPGSGGPACRVVPAARAADQHAGAGAGPCGGVASVPVAAPPATAAPAVGAGGPGAPPGAAPAPGREGVRPAGEESTPGGREWADGRERPGPGPPEPRIW